MDEYVIVPFMGTTRPSNDFITANGVPINNLGRMGCYNANGSLSPVYAFYCSGYGVFLSLSSGFILAGSTGGNYPVETVISHVTTIYRYRTNGFYPGTTSITESRALDIVANSTPPEGSYNIRYSVANGSIIAPTWASPNSTVTGYVTMDSGFTLDESSITVTRNGIAIPFQYNAGVLTFNTP